MTERRSRAPRQVVIAGTGRHVAEGALDTAAILAEFGIDPALLAPAPPGSPDAEFRAAARSAVERWIPRGYDVRRRLADPEATTATMCVDAARKALRRARVRPRDVALVICVTDTPDYLAPATAARVQLGIGAERAAFYDLNSSCAGFTMALNAGANHLRCMPEARYVVVVGAVAYSRFLDPTDLWFRLRFGDGAGAVVLAASDEDRYGLREVTLTGRGRFWDYFGIFGGGSWKGYSPEALAEGYQFLKIRKPYEFNVNRRYWPLVIRKTLAKTGWDAADVDRAFFTQVRREQVEWTCERFGWAPEVSYNTSEKYGYTGSACIPMAMDEAHETGSVKAGDKVLVCASGVGANWTAMTLVWGR